MTEEYEGVLIEIYDFGGMRRIEINVDQEHEEKKSLEISLHDLIPIF